jgi:putative (di)nucleoside polyphosphate hydrolase
VPLDAVIEFKRDVYQLALTELSRFLRRAAPRTEKPRGQHHGHRYPRVSPSAQLPDSNGALMQTGDGLAGQSPCPTPILILPD